MDEDPLVHAKIENARLRGLLTGSRTENARLREKIESLEMEAIRLRHWFSRMSALRRRVDWYDRLFEEARVWSDRFLKAEQWSAEGVTWWEYTSSKNRMHLANLLRIIRRRANLKYRSPEPPPLDDADLDALADEIGS